MINIKIYYKKMRILSLLMVCALSFFSCEDDFLNEVPLSDLSDSSTLTSKAGFETYLIGLVRQARLEYTWKDDVYWITNFAKTDVGEEAGAEYSGNRNWINYITPNRLEVRRNWEWAYKDMISLANVIITNANLPESADYWATENAKNAVIAEARFYRAYTYNFLVNLYGGVPIVDAVETSPKFDYIRSTRDQVLEFVKADLEFAVQWLPSTVSLPGRITKAAADHLLSEVYISLGDYSSAASSASNVINSGLYQLMTNRFGSALEESGDVFSDLFKENNFNTSSGNMVSFLVLQIEEYTDGGLGTGVRTGGSAALRIMGPFLDKIEAPDGISNLPTDEFGRGVGRIRGTNYSIYDIWQGSGSDMRNSEFNFARDFYYNHPDSNYFGELIGPRTGPKAEEDTLRRLYQFPTKILGKPLRGNKYSGRSTSDIYVYRLAETYLLRAEAHFRGGNLQDAANDINIVRERAGATPISAGDVTEEYILDERARELLYEEPRRRTLTRMGLLVERVRDYGLLPESRNSVQDYHGLWPIPQEVIDANFGAELKQNPGYN